MKILIAEDNAFSRTLLKKTLTKAGYDVIAVENGNEAWKILQQDDPPRLALLDWMMPGLNGVELCRMIRRVERALPIYVILLTAKSDKEDVLQGFSAGVDDFIKKPFDSGELLARIQVGRRLVEQQALMHCLVDSIPDPIYMKDSRGTFIGCNSAYANLIGAEPEDVHSRMASEVMPPEKAKKNHMEDLHVLANGKTTEQEGWDTTSDGTRVYLSTIKVPYLESAAGSTGMVAISRNLTKRREMEQELRRLAVAVEQSSESIMITDVKGQVLYANMACEKTTGYSAEEMLGRVPDVFQSSKQDPAFFKKLWGTISSGETWEGQITNLKKDGNPYVEEAVIYPIRNSSGAVVNYVAIARDITSEMAIEKHLRQQQKMNAIGELAGGVSHDFNNILTAILGYVALCMNGVDEESKTYSYLKEIVKAGDRATKLVRQILTFSRQEEQEFHSLELQQIIEDSVSMVQTTLRNNINLEMNLDEDCGPVVGDTTQLQQVVVNLCTNAAHAIGREKPGKLRVRLNEVEVQGNAADYGVELEDGRYACLTVSDTGCGIAPDMLERVFEPYFTTKKKGEGTGFGLSIVHGIVNKHRGVIKVESKLKKGSTFTIYFPLLVEREHELNGGQGGDMDSPQGHGRILFVDDDETVLSMGREILESYGYTVVTASNGRRGLETFKLKPDSFDAIVTDYSMPKMNGHEFLRRSLTLRPDVTAILCSGYMERVDGEDLSNLGHAAFLAKPLDWQELGRLLKREINKRRII